MYQPPAPCSPSATATTSAVISTPYHPDTKEATIFIYDGIPGGVGIAERGYDVLRDLWQRR